MKLIQLTKGKFALVDDADYELVSQYNWCHVKHPGGMEYAKGFVNNRRVYLHRFILEFPCSRIDHRNRNGLDCQRYNLRLCTSSQNRANSKSTTRSTSKFKGVSFNSGRGGIWRASIKVFGKTINLGNFHSEIEAACEYDEAAINNFGEFAKTNF